MYTSVSEEFKKIVKSNSITASAKLVFTEPKITIQANATDSLKSCLRDLTIKDFCYNEGKIIGTVMSKEVEINIINKDNLDLADKEFELFVGVKLANGEYEFIPYGNYIVTEYKDMKSNNIFKLVAYDYMTKLNPKFIDNKTFKPTFPISLKRFKEQFLSSYGLEFEEQELPNDNFIVEAMPGFEGITARGVLSKIAELQGSFAKVNRNNKIELGLRANTTEEVNAMSMNSKLEMNKRYGPVNVVSLGMSNIEGENVTLKNDTSISQYGETTIRIDDNPFVYSQELRERAINSLYDRLKDFTYIPVRFNYKARLYTDCGDTFRCENVNNKQLVDTIVLNQTIKIPATRQSQIESKALTNTQVKNKYISQTEQSNSHTEYMVNKANQTIKELIKKTDGNTEQILQIDKSLQGVSTKLNQTTEKTEKLDKDLANTNQTVANNQANFEDFKTNEYVKSIDNIQKQIDGAIQFWNGSEIPTLNNYPANEWKTENDRINHTADIYTVIKDVNGEMKQGKGYRFDKVGGVWQWVELTDNELSAVQAIADEANKRSKANSNSIKTLEDKNVQVDLTLDGIKTEVSNNTTEIKQITETSKSVTGTNNLSLDNALASNVLDYNVEGNKIQETTEGYQLLPNNGTNITLSGITFTNNKGLYTLKGKAKQTVGFEFNLFNDLQKIILKKDNFYTQKVYIEKGRLNFNIITALQEVDTGNILYNAIIISNIVRSATYQSTKNYKMYTLNAFIPEGTDVDISFRFQMENGKVAHEWEIYTGGQPSPTPDYPQEISCIKAYNLFKCDGNNKTLNGLTITNNNGVFTINGQATQTTALDITQYETLQKLEFKSGKEYTQQVFDINGTRNFDIITAIQKVTGEVLYGFLTSSSEYPIMTKTISENSVGYTSTAYIESGTKVNCSFTVQLVEGKPKSYLPHGNIGVKVNEIIIPIDLQGNELCRIREIKDLLHIDRKGRTTIEKRFVKYVFTGNENFVNIANLGTHTRFEYKNILKGKGPTGESNYFEYLYNYTEQSNHIYVSSAIYIFIDNSIANNNATLKQWLKDKYNSGNPVYVIYELETPQIIELADTNIPLFDGVNNLSLLANMETNTSCNYLLKTPLSKDYATNQRVDNTDKQVDNLDNNVKTNTYKIETNTKSLTNLSQEVNNIHASVTDIQTTTIQSIDGVAKNVETLTKKVDAKMTSEEVNLAIKKELENGTTKVKTETGYTFDSEGLKIAKEGEEMNSQFDNTGMYVKRDNEFILKANHDGVDATNLHAKTYLIIGKNSRFEDFERDGEPRTACFWIGGNS